MISRNYIFKSEPPTRRVLEDRLCSLTGLNVSVTDITKDLNSTDDAPTADDSCESGYEAWDVCFQLPSDNYSEEILCNLEGNQIAIFDSWKDLNRCPYYPFFATAAAIEDLGGEPATLPEKRDSIKALPDYSRLSFHQWKALNGGTKPPAWKWLLLIGSIGIHLLTMLAALPFKCLAELLRLRRTQQEYKRKAAQVEALSSRKHLSRHFKSPRGKPRE